MHVFTLPEQHLHMLAMLQHAKWGMRIFHSKAIYKSQDINLKSKIIQIS